MGVFLSLLSPDVQYSYQNQTQQQIHAPFETYSSVYSSKKSLQLDYSYAPVFNISSPGASGSSINSKKDANMAGDLNPVTSGAVDSQSASQKADQSLGGMDIWTILLLGGIALAGIYLVTKRK